MARPTKKIDPELLDKLAAIHCTMEEMAAVFDCSVDTLERRFADVIKKGKAKGRASLRRLQYESAQKGNTGMLVWLGKQLLNQRDQPEQAQVQVSVDGKNVKVYQSEWGKISEPGDT